MEFDQQTAKWNRILRTKPPVDRSAVQASNCRLWLRCVGSAPLAVLVSEHVMIRGNTVLAREDEGVGWVRICAASPFR